MDPFLITGIQYGFAVETECIINDDSEGSNPSEPSIINTFLPENIGSNIGQQHTDKRVGKYDQELPLFSISYHLMSNIV